MKKKYLIVIILFFAILTNSCLKEEPIALEPRGSDTFIPKTPTEIKIQELFKKYGVRITYKWDRLKIGQNAMATPCDERLVLDYLKLFEITFLEILDKVYLETTGDSTTTFSRKDLPVDIYLLGSGINYAVAEGGLSQEGTVGQAGNIQPNRLTLGGVNNLDLSKLTEKELLDLVFEKSNNSRPDQAGLVGFFYHEYTHFINSKHDIPFGYEKITPEEYVRGTNGWTRLTNSQAVSKGFVIPYGMQNEFEDIATYVQHMVWKTPEELFKPAYINTEKGKAKYTSIFSYFKIYGIDLTLVQKYLNSPEVKTKVTNLKKKTP